MTFSDAIRDGFSKYAAFSGRSSRPAYWWFWLFGLIAIIVAEALDALIGTNYVLALIVWIALLLPSLAVAVRRLHDAGHSGWWLLIGIFPIVGTIVLLIFFLTPSKPPNDWGTGPEQLAAPAV